MKVLHLINKRASDGPGLRNLTRDLGQENIYLSGFWDLTLEDAQSLIGGMIFLHQTKGQPSRFGGQVLSVESVAKDEFARSERVVFRVLARKDGRGAKWRGADHAMASYGGIIDV